MNDRKQRPDTAPRDASGRFGAGNAGRPRGARNKITRRLEALFARDAEAVVAATIKAATEYVEASMVPRPGRWFAVARTGNAEVKLVAGSNVAIHHPSQAGGELVIPQWATGICFYTRIDATSARLSVSGF